MRVVKNTAVRNRDLAHHVAVELKDRLTKDSLVSGVDDILKGRTGRGGAPRSPAPTYIREKNAQ